MKIISEPSEVESKKYFPRHPEFFYRIIRFIKGRLYPICILSNILVPPLYWILVYTAPNVPSYYTVCAHGISAIFYLVDAIFEPNHIIWLDFIFILIYPVFYVILVQIWHAASGEWVYSALDPSTSVTRTALVYIGCFIFYYVGFFIILSISFGKVLLVGFLKKKFQNKIWEQTNASTKKDIELDNVEMKEEQHQEEEKPKEEEEEEQAKQEEKLEEVTLDN
jgi:hypothetical protein